jgi:hypothetical protein
LFPIYHCAERVGGKAMDERRFDRQDALVLALGWFTALLVTLF